MNRPIFSGHESFHCKTYWLKRGYDFIKNGGSFNDSNAVIYLGVGKNMVSSIKYWMKAFGLLNSENEITRFADFILDTEIGTDPYFENTGTLWLMHFNLVNKDYATLYNKTFIDYHRQRNLIDKDKLQNYIRHTCYDSQGISSQYNANTIKKDISVFIHNYCSKSNTKIEDMNSLLAPLNLIQDNDEGFYVFNYDTKEIVPAKIFLYAILQRFPGTKSISFESLQDLALTFCLTNNDMLSLIKELCTIYSTSLVFSDIAGIKELQFKKNIQPESVLINFYSNN